MWYLADTTACREHGQHDAVLVALESKRFLHPGYIGIGKCTSYKYDISTATMPLDESHHSRLRRTVQVVEEVRSAAVHQYEAIELAH